jgi:hypothetical protein
LKKIENRGKQGKIFSASCRHRFGNRRQSADENPQPFELIELIERIEPFEPTRPPKPPKPQKPYICVTLQGFK